MLIGMVFLVLGIWQLWMTKRSFSNLRNKGNAGTSPFIMVSLWSSFVMAILFLGIAYQFIVGNFDF